MQGPDPKAKHDPPPGMSPMKQEDISIVPFKAKRDVPFMPFKKGQGVSLAGWQFEVKNVLPNGNILLITKGRILTQQEEGYLGGAIQEQVEQHIKDK